MKVRVSKCKEWKAESVEKCVSCNAISTQKIIIPIPKRLLGSKKFPVCNLHFGEWLDNKLELQLGDDE